MLNRNQICTNEADFDAARLVTFVNPYSFFKILESDVNLNKFDKICVDGMALKLFLEFVFRRSEKIQRLSFDFTSVANRVFAEGAKKNERGFILGSDSESNEKFLRKITEMFPGINLEGRSGFFGDQGEKLEQLDSLAKSDFDFIVVGMGAVKQEEVAIILADSGFKGRIHTCGGFIHQTAMSESGQYYPSWVNKLNLRFAYRMCKEPSTVRRYLLDYPRAFMLLTRNIEKFRY